MRSYWERIEIGEVERRFESENKLRKLSTDK